MARTITAAVGDQDYRTVARLRIGIGVLGVLLPFAIPIGIAILSKASDPGHFPGSMSGSYYTHMRNIFVGSMCAIGVFLIGYRRARIDNGLSNVAGLLALGVALFPTADGCGGCEEHWTQYVHTGSAIGLLVILGLFCIWRFPQGEARLQLLPKKTSDLIYVSCGAGMALCGILAVLPTRWLWTSFPSSLYVAEAGSVLLFGIAWLLKGLNLDRALAARSVPIAPPAAPMPAAAAAATAPTADSAVNLRPRTGDQTDAPAEPPPV